MVTSFRWNRSFQEVQSIPSRPREGAPTAPLDRRFFSARDLPSPAQIVASAEYAYSSSASRISICAWRSVIWVVFWKNEIHHIVNVLANPLPMFESTCYLPLWAAAETLSRVVDQRSSTTTISMFHGAHDEPITCKFAANAAVRRPTPAHSMAEDD
jgi:hypothetical protein